ncbi:hypothetical protein EYF80_058871 [Liparis tanakae]|uniref:Uncharacterized protein n=1 Tax=Liparis tanakae TaxID=230148 RepID=A0A4Z2EPW3_9TELE|nr:hypothetical protein EYF80_058871 [Liparis tanakae]
MVDKHIAAVRRGDSWTLLDKYRVRALGRLPLAIPFIFSFNSAESSGVRHSDSGFASEIHIEGDGSDFQVVPGALRSFLSSFCVNLGQSSSSLLLLSRAAHFKGNREVLP